MAGLGQVPTSWPLVALAALAVMMALARRGAGFAEGWAFGVGHFAVALRWITEPFQVDAALFGWMAPFALALTVAGFALFWGLPFGLARRLRLGAGGLVALWTGAELVRSLALTGFPWALPGHVWVETPLAQLAALGGAHGLTLLTLGLAAWLARWGLAPRGLNSWGLNSWSLSPWGLAPLGLVGLLWWGLDPGPAAPAAASAPVIRIVSPNVPQHEKWDPALAPAHLRRLLDLSAGPGADLVVWPETALVQLLEEAGGILAVAAEGAGAPVATGIMRLEDDRIVNSFTVTDAQGAPLSVYDKHHLVPFGEYMPLAGLLGRFGLRGLAEINGSGFAAGPGPATVPIPGLGDATPLICYEGIFAEEVAGAPVRPRLLLLVTNDAWFGLRAGPLQHFHLSRLRAIEQGLPLVRSANAGVSAMVDGRGRVLGALPLHEAGALDAALPPALPPTPYARAGDGPVVAALILGLLLAWRRRGSDA